MRHPPRPRATAAILLAVLLAACASPPPPAPPDPNEVFSRLPGYDYVRAPLEVEAGIRAGLRTGDLLERVADLEVRSVVREGVPITMIASVVLTDDPAAGAGVPIRDRVARVIAGYRPRFEDRTLGGADVGYSVSGASRILSWEPEARVVVMVGSHAPGPGVLDVAEHLIEARGGDPGPLLPFTAPDPVSAFAEHPLVRFTPHPDLETGLLEQLQRGPLEPAIVSVSIQDATWELGPAATVLAMGFEPEYASTPEFPDLLGGFLFGSNGSPRIVVHAGTPVTLADLGNEAGALWPDRLGLWVAAFAQDEATALAVAELMIEARQPEALSEPTT